MDNNNPSVLFMDDSPSAAKAAEMILVKEGLDVTIVKTKDELMEKISGSYLAAIVDLNMPEIGGVEALMNIGFKNPHVLMMAYTAADDEKTRKMLREKDVGHLLKTERNDLIKAAELIKKEHKKRQEDFHKMKQTDLVKISKALGVIDRNIKNLNEEVDGLKDRKAKTEKIVAELLTKLNKLQSTFNDFHISGGDGSKSSNKTATDAYLSGLDQSEKVRAQLEAISKRILPKVAAEHYDKMVSLADKTGGFFREHEKLERLESKLEKAGKKIDQLEEYVRELPEKGGVQEGSEEINRTQVEELVKGPLKELAENIKEDVEESSSKLIKKLENRIEESEDSLQKVHKSQQRIKKAHEELQEAVEKIERNLKGLVTEDDFKKFKSEIGGREGITKESIETMVNNAASNIGQSKEQIENNLKEALDGLLRNLVNDPNSLLYERVEKEAKNHASIAMKNLATEDISSTVYNKMTLFFKDKTKFNGIKYLLTMLLGGGVFYAILKYAL